MKVHDMEIARLRQENERLKREQASALQRGVNNEGLPAKLGSKESFPGGGNLAQEWSCQHLRRWLQNRLLLAHTGAGRSF